MFTDATEHNFFRLQTVEANKNGFISSTFDIMDY